MGYAILPVTLELVSALVRLPDGFEVISAHENHWNRTLDLTIKSDLIPDVPEGCEAERLPQLEVTVTQVQLHGETWTRTETRLSWWENGKYREEPVGG